MKMLELFDAPEVTDCYRRTETVIPQQALALANSELSLRAGRKLARKLWDATRSIPETGPRNAAFVAAAFEQVLTRGPTAEESAVCAAFLAEQSAVMRAAGTPPGAAGAGDRDPDTR